MKIEWEKNEESLRLTWCHYTDIYIVPKERERTRTFIQRNNGCKSPKSGERNGYSDSRNPKVPPPKKKEIHIKTHYNQIVKRQKVNFESTKRKANWYV